MKRSEIILMILQVPVDFVLLVLAGMSAFYLRFSDWAITWRPVVFRLSATDFFLISLGVAGGWLLIFALAGLYSTDPNRKLSRDLGRVFLACTTGLGAVALYVMFSQQLFDSRFLAAISWLLAIIYVSVGRVLMRGVKGLLYRLGFGLRRIVVIGSEEIANSLAKVLRERRELGYQVIKQYPWFTDDSGQEMKKLKLDEIIYINPKADAEETYLLLDFCNENQLVFKYSADLLAAYSANMTVSPLAGVPMVELKKTPLDGWGRVIKRMFDVVMSIILLILLSPLMLLTALIILIETGQPVIYQNERVGVRGKNFFTLKFRSMYQADCTGPQFGKLGKRAEKVEKKLIATQSVKTGPVYKIAADPRVTPFGRFIRRFSIDELPQFFNVLWGTMSIVGPRPHQPREVAQYERKYKKVFTLKPGVTGLAQISGRSDLSFEEEMRLDILYIEKWSWWLDLVIFIKTPFVLFRKRKAL